MEKTLRDIIENFNRVIFFGERESLWGMGFPVSHFELGWNGEGHSSGILRRMTKVPAWMMENQL